MSKNKKSITVWRIVRVSLLTLLLLLLMFIAFGYFVGSRHFVVHQQTFYFQDLPSEFDGYRILQFGDFHAATFQKGHTDDVETIVRLINAQKCDAIMFVGDAVCRNSSELDPFLPLLKTIKAPDGVFAIMGNHDYGTYNHFSKDADRLKDVRSLQQKIRSCGWNLLLNQHADIYRGSSHISIVGVENQGIPPFPQYADVPQACKGLTRTDFAVLLSHDPTHWHRGIQGNTSLQLTLSGHTHAGQFKLFGWSPCSLRYPEWSGAYSQGSQILNVTEGVGNSILPFRFGAWPEVNVITLKRKR